MEREYQAKTEAQSAWVRCYLIWTCVVLFFYAVTPSISYLMFWKLIPTYSLSTILGVLLIPTVLSRVLLLLARQINFPGREFALTLLLLLWILILQLLWYPIVSRALGSKQVFSTLAFTIVATWIVFLGGEALAYLWVQRPRLAQVGAFVAYTSLVLVVIDGVVRGFKYYGLLLFAFQNPTSGDIYNYLALGDSLAIVGLLLLSIQRKGSIWRCIGLYFVTILFLLFAYSRTSLLAFSVIGLTTIHAQFRVQSQKQRVKFLISSIVIGTILITLLVFFQPNKNFFNYAHVTLDRVSSLFSGEDLSLQMRFVLLQHSVELLPKHWLLGRFLIEAFDIGWGAYVHNWLSFWLAYGIGPFLLSVGVVFLLLLKSWRIRNRGSAGAAAFGILGYCVLAIAFARSYIWPFIWFALGFTGTLPALMDKQRAMP